MKKNQKKELYKFVNGKRIVALTKKECESCGKEYQPKQSKSRFCCIQCYWKSRIGKPSVANWSEEVRQKMSDTHKGELNPQYGKPSWNSGKELPEYRGEKSPRYKGGWIQNGYHFIVKNAKDIANHRSLMQDHLGRILDKDEVVHHINGNKLDNRIENLQVLTRSEHIKLHQAESKK